MSQKNQDDWIKEFDYLVINGKKYYFRCVWSFNKKAPNEDKPAIQLVINIFDDDSQKWINWEDFKGSYLSEKLTKNDFFKCSK